MEIKYKAFAEGDLDGQLTAQKCDELGVPHLIVNGECALAHPTSKMISDLSGAGVKVVDAVTGRVCVVK